MSAQSKINSEFFKFGYARQRILIVPTIFGFVWATLVFGLAAWSLIYMLGNLAPMILFLALIGLLVMLQTNQNLSKIAIARISSSVQFVGAKASVDVVIRNESDEARFQLRVRVKDRKTAGFFEGVLAELPAKSDALVSLSGQSKKRGIVSEAACTVSTVFPMGLFYSSRSFKVPSDLIVAPRLMGVKRELPLKKRSCIRAAARFKELFCYTK